MPTVLDAGSVQLSNVDVLKWVRDKRAQHQQEDQDDKLAGRKKAVRPANFMKSLEKHEDELTSRKLPYASNPGAYEGQNGDLSLVQFLDRFDEAIVYPLEDKYKSQKLSYKELRRRLGPEQESKALTATEILMIQNLAPENANLLQNLIDRSDTRFDDEEQAKIVQSIKDIFRCGEKLPGKHTRNSVSDDLE